MTDAFLYHVGAGQTIFRLPLMFCHNEANTLVELLGPERCRDDLMQILKVEIG